MATVVVHIRVVEGGEARFGRIAADLFRTSHAVETGLRRYEYWRTSEPREYCALIACDDFQTFIAHQTSTHHEDASPALGEVIETIRLEWVDPVPGASDLGPTRMQDAPADADDLTRRYTKRFAAEISSWWAAVER